MKQHVPVLALVFSLLMLLGSVIYLATQLKSGDGTVMLLAGGCITIVGVLGGISQPAKPAPDAPQLTIQEIRTLLAEPDPKGNL